MKNKVGAEWRVVSEHGMMLIYTGSGNASLIYPDVALTFEWKHQPGEGTSHTGIRGNTAQHREKRKSKDSEYKPGWPI